MDTRRRLLWTEPVLQEMDSAAVLPRRSVTLPNNPGLTVTPSTALEHRSVCNALACPAVNNVGAVEV